MVGLLIIHSLKFYENGSLNFIYYCEVQPLQMILVGLIKATEGGGGSGSKIKWRFF